MVTIALLFVDGEFHLGSTPHVGRGPLVTWMWKWRAWGLHHHLAIATSNIIICHILCVARSIVVHHWVPKSNCVQKVKKVWSKTPIFSIIRLWSLNIWFRSFNLWLMSYHILRTNSDTKMTFTVESQTIVNSYANIQRTFRNWISLQTCFCVKIKYFLKMLSSITYIKNR